MSDLNRSIDTHEIQEMGIIVKVNDEPTYVDFEIDSMSAQMKKQLFRQLTSLVYTYKTTNGFIWPDEIYDI